MSSKLTYQPFPPFALWAGLSVELKYWRQARTDLRDLRERASPAQVEEAARYVTRATAVDTAAIEGLYPVDRGFTLSVAAQAGAWEQDFDEKGLDARRHFEAQLRASELVLDAATLQYPVVEVLVRALHEHVCAAQDTYRVLTPQGWQGHALVHGEYKRFPNNPHGKEGQKHAYSPVERVQEEMQRLVAELGSEAFAAAPAPTQAAYAHYAFVSIHPFADGNGRVARALASIYLVRATSVPFLLFADERRTYLAALESADRGSYRELIELVRDRSIGAMNYMALRLAKALAPKSGDLRDASSALFGDPAPTEENLDLLAQRLLDEVEHYLQGAFDRLSLSNRLAASMSTSDRSNWQPLSPPEGYRALAVLKQPSLVVRIESLPPASGGCAVTLYPLVALDHEHPMRLRIEETLRVSRFEASAAELYPELSRGLKERLTLWTEVLVAHLAELALCQAAQSVVDVRSAE